MFTEGCHTYLWRKALISPIFKGKGKSRNDPLSYRPVSLISNPCKGLCYILDKRLLSHLEEQNILVEEQNGFRQGRSYQDHIFSLVMILKNLIDQKKSTFFCFVDYSAAFDLVDRDLLLFYLTQCRCRLSYDQGHQGNVQKHELCG